MKLIHLFGYWWLVAAVGFTKLVAIVGFTKLAAAGTTELAGLLTWLPVEQLFISLKPQSRLQAPNLSWF